MGVVKHILRYVVGTISWGLWYGRKDHDSASSLMRYSDSYYASDVDKMQSNTGIIFFLGNSLITWESMKQKIVAQSSYEVEYVDAANATCQTLWLTRVLAEIQGRAPSVPLLRVDNKSAIALIKNPVLSRESRHIQVKYHLVRESAEVGLIMVEFVGNEDQLGDTLTKSLGRVKFQDLRNRIGLNPIISTSRVRRRVLAVTLACFSICFACVCRVSSCSLSGVSVWESCALVKARARRATCPCHRYRGHDSN
jgi:hypothetical protein